MELRLLESFARVAALGSLTRAAEELHLTQPALTRQIAALEKQLGVVLLARLPRGVALTPAGEALEQHALRLLRMADEAAADVREVAAGRSGRLVVGASSTAATYVLPPLLARFRRDHPGVELSVLTGGSSRVCEMVRGGEAHVGVVTAPADGRALRSIVLGELETVVVLHPKHPLAGAEWPEIAPEALAEAPLILMQSGTNLRARVDEILAAAGVSARVDMELDSVEAIKQMVAAGLGLSLIPAVAVRREVAAGELVARPLAGVDHSGRHLCCVVPTDREPRPPLSQFLEVLQG
jgi:DNA-binding transcriptional LysR family regulator